MRSKVLFAIVFGILLVVFLKTSFKKESKTGKLETTKDLQTNITLIESDSARQKAAGVDSTVITNPTAQILFTQTNSVEERIIELMELGARNDPESFQKIIFGLSDADPEIREAALEATIQFGDRDAIPILKELAAKTDDPQEKVEILNAAEYLALPSFSEIRAKRRTNLNSKAISNPRD